MDPELIAYLDRQFGEVNRQFGEVNRQFGEVNRQFGEVNRRFDEVDSRFDSNDRKFESIDRKFESIDRKFESIEARFDSNDRKFESIDRQFVELRRELINRIGIEAESLRDEIRTVAEGVVNLDEKMERRFHEMDAKLEDVKAFTVQAYRDLDRRVSALEARAEA